MRLKINMKSRWKVVVRTKVQSRLTKVGHRSELLPEVRTIAVKQGDVLLLYTDGVVDAANGEQEQFGEQRLHDIVRSSLPLSATEICERVADRVQAFTAGTPQWDDITLAVLKVKCEFTDSETGERAMLEFSTP